MTLLFGLLVLSFEHITMEDAIAQATGEGSLREGIAQYNGAMFEGAIKKLQDALRLGLTSSNDIVEANKYLAFAYAATNNDAESIQHFLAILRKDDRFELPLSESPKLRKLAEKAKQAYSTLTQYSEGEKKSGLNKWLFIAGGGLVAGGVTFLLVGNGNGTGNVAGNGIGQLPISSPLPDN